MGFDGKIRKAGNATDFDEKIRWLERYRQSLQEERMFCQELDELEARRKADKTGRLKKVRAELRKTLSNGVAVRGEVMKVITGIDDPRDQAILYRRYILGETFETISAEMAFDERWVRRCHKKCVEKLVL